MNNILKFMESSDFKKQAKEIVYPIGQMIYNEIYIYIWFICLYNVFLIFLVLANLFLLIRLLKPSKQPSVSTE
jgi:hypothetical protein